LGLLHDAIRNQGHRVGLVIEDLIISLKPDSFKTRKISDLTLIASLAGHIETWDPQIYSNK
jgi:hypothetical protein